MIGADEPKKFDARRLGELVQEVRLKHDFEYAYWGGPAQYLSNTESLIAGCLCGPDQVGQLAKGGDIYRDDRPYLEYLPVKEQTDAPILVQMIAEQLSPLAPLFDNAGEEELAKAQVMRRENLQEIVARVFVARAQLLEAAGDLQGAAEGYQASLEVLPSYPRANFALGRFLDTQGDSSLATRFYQRVLAIQPDNEQALQRMGDSLLATGQLEAAREPLMKLLKLDPLNVQANITIGWILGQQGNNSQAMEHFDTALRIEPQATRALLGSANVWQSAGESDKAVQAYQQILELDPRQTEARIGLAMALQSQGMEDQALQHFQLALDEQPENVNLLSSVAWLLATHSDVSKRDPQQAKLLAERAWNASDHQAPLAADALAAAYAGLNQFDRAVEIAELAIQAAQKFDLSQLMTEIRLRQEQYKQGRVLRN